jgi:hypothetical protein
MRATRVTLSAAILALAATSIADAQEGRRNNRQSGGTSTAQTANAPLSDNPVKRTWDFTKRFGIAKYSGGVGCETSSAEFDQFIAGYNAGVNAFLSGPSDPKKLNLERKNYIKQVLGAERDISAYVATYEETGKRSPESFVPLLADDVCRAKAQQRSLISIREGLKAMGRVYPDMTEVAPILAKANAAIAKIGDDKSIQKYVSANRAATLASVRMKPALSSNPAWEKGLREGFARLVQGETILKLHLYSANWYVHKNELTSYPEYRQIGAWVATKRANGTCWINSIDLWQNYVGTGFDSGEYKLGQAPQQILCENV